MQTKSPEQNVKLQNTVDDEPLVTIEPMAQQFKSIVKFSYDELREEFDNYWKEHGDLLVKRHGYKGRKLKGGGFDMKKAQQAMERTKGIPQLYRGKLSEIMGEMVETEAEQKIMMITAASLYNFEPGTEEALGVVLYYFWPKVTKAKEELDFTVVNPYADITAESQFAERHVPMLIENSKEFTLSEDTVVKMGHRLSLDVITSEDGKPADNLTFRSAWHELKDLPEGLSAVIVGRELGELFEVDWTFGDKTLHSHIKIYSIMDAKRLSADDPELFIQAGFESMEECFGKFKADFDKRMEEGKAHLALDEIMTKVLLGAEIEAIPQNWVDLHRTNFMQRHIDGLGGDKRKAMQSIGAVDEEDMLRKFEGEVYKETINQMAINWYAEAFNCLPDRESVMTDVATRVIWVEADKEK